jgi:hypothetical protein
VSEHFSKLADSLAQDTSRRGFLARVSRGLFLLTGGSVVAAAVKPGESDAYHLCGHTYTTGSCIHPNGLPRVDNHGFPIRAGDGKPVDDIGRLIDGKGHPVDDGGHHLRDPDGRQLPPSPRTKVCSLTGKAYGFNAIPQGSWYRCCGGRVRKLWDCCAHHSTRINGDAALVGYCYGGRNVFCVTYYQTKIPC